jgi:Uri superfamily endonuclease
VAAPLRAIWYTPGQTVYEHTWAKTLLSLADNRVIASGFGASDCRCSTHLIHTAGTPPLAAFQQTTDASLTICDPIE